MIRQSTRRRRASPDAPAPARAGADDRLRYAALAILLALAGARLLINEQLIGPWTIATGGPDWPTPATSMGINALILLAGLLWLIAQSLRPRPIVARWALACVGLVMLAGLISTLAASNKSAARNGAIQLAGHLLSFWLLLQLMCTRFARQLVLLCLLTVGTLFILYALQQHFVDNPRFIHDQWPEQRDKVFAEQGWDAADPPPVARQFEERVRSAEVTGFTLTSNIAAATMILVLFGLIGWGIAKAEAPPAPLRRALAGLAAGPALAAIGAIWVTGSRGGTLACAAAALLMMGLTMGRRWLARRWKLGLACAAALVGVVAAGVALFCARMEQPAPDSRWYRSGAAQSLLIRWHYWDGAAAVVREHPLAGVGAGNFRTHYLHHKRPEALEQPKFAHNFALHALVEYGPLGAAALLALIAWLFWRLARPRDAEDRPTETASPARRSLVIRLPIVLLAGLLLIWVVMPALHAEPVRQAFAGNLVSFLLLMLLAPPILLALLLSRDELRWPSDVGEGWIRLAIGCGLAGFLLASLIDFAMWESGPATLFWTLAAVAVASRLDHGQPSARPRGRIGWALGSAGVVALLVLLHVGVYLPVARGERVMLRARKTHAAEVSTAWVRSHCDGLDPALPLGLAELKRAPDRGRLYELARRLDPAASVGWLRSGHAMLDEATDADGRAEALRRMKRGVELDPTSVEAWWHYGDALMEAKRPGEAADAYARAVELDDIVRRYDTKGLFHLSRSQRDELEGRLVAAMPSPETAPASQP